MYENKNCFKLFDLRVVHVAPVQEDVHVHVLGALQVPLFWQGEAQIAEGEQKISKHISASVI